MSFEPTISGRTGLALGRLGLSAAWRVPARAVEEAFELRADYFRWGALRRGMMAEGVRRLAQKNRDKIIIGLQNHWPRGKADSEGSQGERLENCSSITQTFCFSGSPCEDSIGKIATSQLREAACR